MFYVLVDVNGEQLLQEVCNGNVIRYTHMDGVTRYVSLPGGAASFVVDADPAQPTWALSDPVAAPAVSDSQLITRAAFRKRFSVSEKIAMEMAMLDDPTKTIPERTGAAYLRAMINDFNNSPSINLQDATVIDALNKLEQYGIIGAGRAAEVLNALVVAEENYHA